jgi:hypothetical protein
MKTLAAGVVILATISTGFYAISRKMDIKKEKIPKCFHRIQQILRVLVDLSTVISMVLVFFTLLEMQKEMNYMLSILEETAAQPQQ